MIQNLDFDSLENVFEMAYGDTIQVGDVTLKIEQTEDGALITATDKTGTTSAIVSNGKDGANGKDGVDGKDGVNGSDGYTPRKGIDYYTEEDKAEIVNEVLSALPDGDEVSY